jgi:hypothetical protein
MSMFPVNETVVVPVVGRRMVWFGLSRVTRMAWLVSGAINVAASAVKVAMVFVVGMSVLPGAVPGRSK